MIISNLNLLQKPCYQETFSYDLVQSEIIYENYQHVWQQDDEIASYKIVSFELLLFHLSNVVRTKVYQLNNSAT